MSQPHRTRAKRGTRAVQASHQRGETSGGNGAIRGATAAFVIASLVALVAGSAFRADAKPPKKIKKVTPSAVFVVHGEKCKSARKATVYYRSLTWERQQARYGQLADRTPIVRGKTCRWARLTASTWQARAAAARRSLKRWQRQVGGTISLLERGLRGTPMQGTGVILEKWGRRYGVSPFFMVATAATESSIGHAACSNNHYNVWGLASCTGSWYVPPFRSWDEAISFYARFLAERWPGHSTPYSFRGYAACDECWGRKVSEWMGRLFGVSAVTRYP